MRFDESSANLPPTVRRRVRIALGLFMFGLVLSGVTAFPLVHEIDLLARWAGVLESGQTPALPALAAWIGRVREALHATGQTYPFLAYGTDWLAFGHLVIAAFFVLPWSDPARYAGVLRIGLWACAGVVPLAIICGQVRGIPVVWRLLDCSFGVVGAVPLLYCQWQLRAGGAHKPVG